LTLPSRTLLNIIICRITGVSWTRLSAFMLSEELLR